MDRALTLPALVLLDEVGVGTDPIEGGALGQAVVDHLRNRGAHIVATTHYEQLKTYASTTEGVASAAFGFDPDTYAPTYRLLYGTPGRSLAIEIAARLGMNPAVLAEARRAVTEREARLAEHLAKIDADLRDLDHERRLVARERESLAASEERVRTREQGLKDKEDRLRQRTDEEIESRLRSARQEIDRVVDDLRRQVERLSAEAARRAHQGAGLSTGEAGMARAGARAALDQVGARLKEQASSVSASVPAAAGAIVPGATPKTGDRVLMKMLGLEGRVLAVSGGAAEVEVRGKRLHARFAELQVLAEASASRVNVNVQVESREGMATEINVIGCTVDEAIGRLEKFLDETLLADERIVRIIHGHGTGQLRRAIGEHLQRHPMVARHQAAPYEQGGSGVTVVELKD
jgi:DNA mismatch repair protein MutS2